MRRKEPDQKKLNEIFPESEKGELVEGSIADAVEQERRKLLQALSEYTKVYPGRRKISSLLEQQLRGAKNDEFRKQLLEEDIAFIDWCYNNSTEPEAKQFMEALKELRPGQKSKYQHVQDYLFGEYGWSDEKKEKLIQKWGSMRAVAEAVMRDLKQAFPDDCLPSETTLREYLGLK